jgi:AcrR family transcriptional regulator
MPDEKDVRQRILVAAEKLFTTYGFSRVSMDEIASELGMSKKTLYKHFPTKEALLLQVIETFYANLNADIAAIRLDEKLSFTEKISRFIALVANRVAVNRDPFVQDIQRNVPQMWARIHTLRRETIQAQFRAIIEEGIRHGVFQSDLDPSLITLIVLAAIERLTDPETWEQHAYSFSEIFQGTLRVVFQGILTDKARQALE